MLASVLRRGSILNRHCWSPKTITRGIHQENESAIQEQTVELKDGRRLGFAEYGDSRGVPTFCFHGSPGSRYDGYGFHEVAKKLNVRIICPDRPGHGLSTLQPNRKLLNYPKDISQLAKHLHISKYHVFGVSGGGPYVVACAHSSPKHELMNAAVVAGMGPPAVINVKDAGFYTVMALQLHKWVPGILRSVTRWTLADDKRIEQQLRFAFKFLQEEDRAIVASEEAMASITMALKAAYAQGPDGVIQEGQILRRQWDFELKDVHRRVMLFYGSKDDRTPIAFGRYYRQHLPNAELLEFDDASHFTMQRHDEEILKRIVQYCD